MNFLAHFYLSFGKEDAMLGNFLADFLKNRDLPLLSNEVRAGVMLHRAIDTFTDAHPAVRQSSKRLHAVHGKYAPVVVDVFYDFLLAKQWQQHHASEDLDIFIKNIYTILASRLEEMPHDLAKRTVYLIEKDWLKAYTTLDGLAFVFKKMETQTRFPSRLSEATISFLAAAEDFEDDFNIFFPDLVSYVRTHFFEHFDKLKH